MTRESPPVAWAPFLLLVLGLLSGAILNGFPLIFPDSGTYLGIAFGPEYAIDRSSFYGLLLKPLVGLAGGAAGLWIAISVQAIGIAAVLTAAWRTIAPESSGLWLLLLVPLTALPWHAGQVMPDAFTGPLVLVTWLAARRGPGAPGTVTLWIAAVAMATTHYTHLVLLAATAATTLIATPRTDLRRRAIAAGVAILVTAGLLTGANRIALHRTTLSPLGPVFLFARINEDGLVRPWLDRHCGRDAPAALCAERAGIVTDSQALLWGDADSLVGRHIWHGGDAERWRWVAMMGAVNHGAIAERPLAFLASSARGTLRQFVSLRPLDDECPERCTSTVSGIGYTLARYRPATVAMLHRSAQGRGTLPKPIVRAIVTPVAVLAILLLPWLALRAWQRHDAVVRSLAAAIAVALVVNAGMAGALSDVHDRYQSRLAWLAPLLVLLAWRRWRDPQSRIWSGM